MQSTRLHLKHDGLVDPGAAQRTLEGSGDANHRWKPYTAKLGNYAHFTPHTAVFDDNSPANRAPHSALKAEPQGSPIAKL